MRAPREHQLDNCTKYFEERNISYKENLLGFVAVVYIVYKIYSKPVSNKMHI